MVVQYCLTTQFGVSWLKQNNCVILMQNYVCKQRKHLILHIFLLMPRTWAYIAIQTFFPTAIRYGRIFNVRSRFTGAPVNRYSPMRHLVLVPADSHSFMQRTGLEWQSVTIHLTSWRLTNRPYQHHPLAGIEPSTSRSRSGCPIH